MENAFKTPALICIDANFKSRFLETFKMTLLYKNKIRDHLSEETGVQEILDLDVSVMKWGETTFFLVDVSVDERKSDLGILSYVNGIMQEIDRLSISTWKTPKLFTGRCYTRLAGNRICYPPELISYMEMGTVSGKVYEDLIDLFESSDDDDESFPISQVFTVCEDVSSSSSDDEGSDVDSLADIEPQYITEDHFVSVLRNAYSNWSPFPWDVYSNRSPFGFFHSDDFDVANHPLPKPAPVTPIGDWEDRLKPDEELEKTDNEALQCCLCNDYKRTVMLWPCECFYYCDKCFRNILTEKNLQKTCPMCRQEFKNILKPRF